MRALFKLALKRDPGLFIDEYHRTTGIVLGIGDTGTHKSSCSMNYRALGMPGWQFPQEDIPCSNNSVAYIHCYHFMEHLTGAQIPLFLLEVQRVLATRGVFQFGVPLAGTELSFQDLDHKSFWTASTLKNLLGNEHYHIAGTNAIKLKIGATAIIGVTERNLMVVGQLIKE